MSEVWVLLLSFSGFWVPIDVVSTDGSRLKSVRIEFRRHADGLRNSAAKQAEELWM